jgi:REP element-mobilizing transposase RayT
LYFNTICIQKRKCLLANIIGESLVLNEAGKMVEMEWLALGERFPAILLHEYIVMPNHFHGIIEIVGSPLVGDHRNEKGQPQGIAPTAPPGNAPTSAPGIGQPQGIAPTAPPGIGQPQGIAPTSAPGIGQPQGIAPTPTSAQKTVGEIMGAFKSITTGKYIEGVKKHKCVCINNKTCTCSGWKIFDKKLWQRNYWEHIIRNEESYQRISQYILKNPAKWVEDQLHPQTRI